MKRTHHKDQLTTLAHTSLQTLSTTGLLPGKYTGLSMSQSSSYSKKPQTSAQAPRTSGHKICLIILVVLPLIAKPAQLQANAQTLARHFTNFGLPWAAQQTTHPFFSKASPLKNQAATALFAEYPATEKVIRYASRVSFGRDIELLPTEAADSVVAIFCSAFVKGYVSESVVTVLGDAYIDSAVKGTVVTLLGSVYIGQNGKIDGDTIVIGGKIYFPTNGSPPDQSSLTRPPVPKDFVRGKVVEIDLGVAPYSAKVIKSWLHYCLLNLRLLPSLSTLSPIPLKPLWQNPQQGITPSALPIWLAWIVILGLCSLVVTLFPRSVQLCVFELNRRPTTTFLIGALASIGVPLLLLLLLLSVVGLLVVPLILILLLVAVAFGNIACFQFIGHKLTGIPLETKTSYKLVAFLVGSLVMTGLLTLPAVSFIVGVASSLWGLGALATAMATTLKSESQSQSTVSHDYRINNPPSTLSQGHSEPAADTNKPQPGPEIGTPDQPGSCGTVPAQGPLLNGELPEALRYPRAGFWRRTGANLIDLLLTGLLLSEVPIAGLRLLLILAYFVALWTLQGTTIGGVIFHLKVVRTDGKPMSFSASLVRALASVLSVASLLIGYLWIIWDKENQAWHDKIAGTVVVRLPKAPALI